MTASRRGQANLLVVGVVLVVLVAVTATAVALADGALASERRDATERRAAVAAADALVAPDAPVTRRANVVDRAAAGELTAAALDDLAPPVRDRAVRVRLGDRTLVERGDPTGGTTVRRVVLVAGTDERTHEFDLGDDGALTLPRRTARLTVAVRTGPNTTVETVRANDRVLLHDPDGLEGETTVPVPRYETLRLTVDADGGDGVVTVTSYPETTNKATLEVTVGDGT